MKPGNIEERKAARKRGAARGVLIFAVIQVLTAAATGALCFVPDAPGWLVVLFAAMAVLCLVAIIPAIVVLKQRFKEIEGGELDAAAEY